MGTGILGTGLGVALGLSLAALLKVTRERAARCASPQRTAHQVPLSEPTRAPPPPAPRALPLPVSTATAHGQKGPVISWPEAPPASGRAPENGGFVPSARVAMCPDL